MWQLTFRRLKLCAILSMRSISYYYYNTLIVPLETTIIAIDSGRWKRINLNVTTETCVLRVSFCRGTPWDDWRLLLLREQKRTRKQLLLCIILYIPTYPTRFSNRHTIYACYIPTDGRMWNCRKVWYSAIEVNSDRGYKVFS